MTNIVNNWVIFLCYTCSKYEKKGQRMKTRIIPSLGLLLLLMTACAPATAPVEPAAEQQPVVVAPTPTAFQPSDSASAPTVDVVTAPTEPLAPAPAATSRGDGLQATNPSDVTLASGGLQLVEFFRFT